MSSLSLSFNNLLDLDLHMQAAQQASLRPLPFVEVLWDNYCHLDPIELRDTLHGISDCVSLHVMMSKFMECSAEKFTRFAKVLAGHVAVIKPARVSDHIARFTVGERHVSVPLEHPYRDVRVCAQRISELQDTVGQQLLIENYASTEVQGSKQIEFLEELMSQTGCGLLFDVSNAVVAEINGVLPATAWLDFLAGSEVHAHIGGYSYWEQTGLYHDSHDAPVSDASLSLLDELDSRTRLESLCYERDYNKSIASMSDDLQRIAATLSPAQQRLANHG